MASTQGYQQSPMGRTPEDTPAHDEHNKGTMGKLMDKIKQPFEKKKHDKEMQQQMGTDNTGLAGANTGYTGTTGTGATGGQGTPEGVQVNPGDTVVITGVAVTGGVIPYTVDQQSGLGNTDKSTLPQIQQQSTYPATGAGAGMAPYSSGVGADKNSTDNYRSTGAVDSGVGSGYPATGASTGAYTASGTPKTVPQDYYTPGDRDTEALDNIGAAGYGNTPSPGYDNMKSDNTSYGKTDSGYDNTTAGYGRTGTDTTGYKAGGYGQQNTIDGLQDPTPVAAEQLGMNKLNLDDSSKTKTYGSQQRSNIGATDNITSSGYGNTGAIGYDTNTTSGYGNTPSTGYDNNTSSAYGNTGTTGYNKTDKPIPSSGYGQTGSAGVGNVADVAGPIPGYTENKAGGAGYTDPVTGRVRDAGGYDGTGTVPWTNPRINPYGVDPNDADPYLGVDTTGKNGTGNTGSGNTQSKGVIGKIADKLKGNKNKNDTDETTTGATGYDQSAGYNTTSAYDNTTSGYGATSNIEAVERTPVQEVDTLPNVFENKPYDNAVDTYGTGKTGATGYDYNTSSGYGNTGATGYDTNTTSGYGNDTYGQDNTFGQKGGVGQKLKQGVANAAQSVQNAAQGVQNKMNTSQANTGSAGYGNTGTTGYGNTGTNAADNYNRQPASWVQGSDVQGTPGAQQRY